MKTPTGCKLIGAQQALSGIDGTVTLLHSVVGCYFGTLAMHLPNSMTRISQACTVIGDEDVIFGGEASLEKALRSVDELYRPSAIFVLTGCISEIVKDDVPAVLRRFGPRTPAYHLPAAGFTGDFSEGYEQGLLLLADAMDADPPKEGKPSVNIIGMGADDYRARNDIAAIAELLGDQVRLGAVLSCCGWQDVQNASGASLNLVLGRGEALAKRMEERFGIPYAVIDYPYGATGARQLRDCLNGKLGIAFGESQRQLELQIAKRLEPLYAYLQALYGIPAAIVGNAARARGMRRFLQQELGMAVVAFAERERLCDIEDFYAAARRSEAALLFGSSFEQALADELEIPLLRFDYPVFDEVCVSYRPFAGCEGAVCLVEDMINAVMRTRKIKGALYP